MINKTIDVEKWAVHMTHFARTSKLSIKEINGRTDILLDVCDKKDLGEVIKILLEKLGDK